jgi:hypothetical protein
LKQTRIIYIYIYIHIYIYTDTSTRKTKLGKNTTKHKINLRRRTNHLLNAAFTNDVLNGALAGARVAHSEITNKIRIKIKI